MPNIFEDFDSPIATAVETPPAEGENVFSDFPMPEPIDPAQELRRQQSQNQETLVVAKQYNVPAHEAYSLVAGPEPSMFGRLLGKVKDLADEWILRPEQVGPEAERWTRAGKEMARGGLAVGAEAISKLSLGALDVLTNKTVGDRALADLVLRVTDQRAMTPEEKAKAETLGYLPAFVLPGMAVRKGLSYVPAAKFLKTILGAGLTFGSTDLALQESRKLITGEPIDWRGVHLQSGVGVLFGFGEVAVAAAMTGLAKGIEKYWGEKGIELAAKIKPEGRTLQEQVALQEAEIRADVERAKEAFRKTGKMPDDLMEKYVYGKPKEGSALAEKVEIKAENPAKKIEKVTVPIETRTGETGVIKPTDPEQSFSIYKRLIPNATEQEIVQMMLEDDQPVPERLLEKYPDVLGVADRLEDLRMDRIIAERVKARAEVAAQPSSAVPAAVRVAETPVAERQPWEMTREEFTAYIDEIQKGKKWFDKEKQIANIRQEIVSDALSEGKPVPRAVLEEYKSEKWAQEALAKVAPETARAGEGEKAEGPVEPTIESEQLKPPDQRIIGKPGFDRLTPLIVEQVVNTTADVAKRAAEIASDLPKTVHFYTGRAAEVIEKHYGETGKPLARDVREIAQRSSAWESKQSDDLKKLLKPLSHEDRLRVMEIDQGRRIHITDGKPIDAATRARLKKSTDGFRAIMDKDMREAAAVGYKRFVGGTWREPKGSGKATPQVLNAKGRAAMNDLRQHGRANPAVQHAIEQMVKEGQATNEEDALAKLVDWNNRRLRGRYGYFESTRVLLPNSWVEFDPDKFIFHVLQKNALRIEAARQWGLEPVIEEGLFGPMEAEGQNQSVDFAEARAMIKQIGQKYGSNHEEVLKKWLRTNFGLSNDLPEYVSDMINTLNHYQTVARLGFRVPSALRNLTQGDVNMFTAPLSAHWGAIKTLALRHWSQEAQKLYDEAVRSGAVVGQKELAEVEKGPTGEERLGVAGMKMFGAAEESNHIRAAIIGRFSAEKHIEDLIALREGGRLEKLMQQLKYLSIDPEKYLTDLLQRRSFVNTITDEELDRVLAGPLTLDDYEQIMYRASVDTQFIRNIATRPIPWRTNPWLRLALKFKTFGIDQTRLVWDEAFKQAAKGTFAPMAKYFLFAVIGGEIYNVVRDILFGRDESLTQTMLERPEKRTPKDVALKLVNDFVDGAGVGILTDVTYGIGNFLVGPVGQSIKNSMDALADWRHPWMSAQRLFKREFAVSRDIEGLWNRADAAFFNDNNEYFDYMRWRDRAFEWKDQVGKGTGGKVDIGTKIEKGVKEILIGRPRYEKKIAYEYAARQVTIGDVDDAAEYLAEEILANPQKSAKEMRTSFESSMRNYAPFADIAQKDLSKFLSTFSAEDQAEGRKIQQEWIARYEQAINKAMKIASETRK